MFERNEILTDLIAQLYEACAPLNRGDTIGHDAIARILRVAPHEGHWQQCIARLKRRMEDERGITLWSEREVGYRLMLVVEQLTLAPRRRLKRACRQMARGIRHAEAVPDTGLNAHQRRVKAAQIELMKSARREAVAQYRRQSALLRPTQVNPRRVVPV